MEISDLGGCFRRVDGRYEIKWMRIEGIHDALTLLEVAEERESEVDERGKMN